MTDVKPWALGPLELIRHAEGHLRAYGDMDRRVALIGFDNAIEACITTYLKLHPLQRGGKQFRSADVTQWQRNYHTKLEFLETFVTQLGTGMVISRDEMVWYHQLRNELYHSGNGLVPRGSHLQGIHRAAVWVFNLLYGVDIEQVLREEAIYEPTPAAQDDDGYQSATMRFLQAYIEFEGAFSATLALLLGEQQRAGALSSITKLWDLFLDLGIAVPEEWRQTVGQAHNIRNQILGGSVVDLGPEQVRNLADRLDEMASFLGQYSSSVDILPLLHERYPGWIRQDLESVRLLNREATVFLEAVVKRSFYKEIRLEDLSFIDDTPKELLDSQALFDDGAYQFFSEKRPAQENALRLLEELDPYSIHMVLDLFDPAKSDEIEEALGRSEDRAQSDV